MILPEPNASGYDSDNFATSAWGLDRIDSVDVASKRVFPSVFTNTQRIDAALPTIHSKSRLRSTWIARQPVGMTLMHKTVKSLDNCGDLGTKTSDAGTISLHWSMNGLVNRGAMNEVSRTVGATTISSGESRKLRAAAPTGAGGSAGRNREE